MRRPLSARAALARVLALSTLALPTGCLERPISPNEPRTTTGYWDKSGRTAIDKIDILLVIDDSPSMGDKQKLLAAAVPDLVGALANPGCIDPATQSKAGVAQPSGPLEPCPAGAVREFDPVLDIHVGIISSSLGGLNNFCEDPTPSDGIHPLDDDAHLLDLKIDGTPAPTYAGLHFLAWDPAQQLPDGPGEADLLTDSGADANDTALLPVLADMVRGVGQKGCGYEATLEAAYRFLVDPEPPVSVSADGFYSVPGEIDQELLEQRRRFLRPDSMVAVVILSDENDCSVAPDGLGWLALSDGGSFARPRAECATNPDDPCCRSCADDQTGCPEDPSCKDANGNLAKMTLPGVDTNLLCFDGKRRFGRDMLAPISRYTSGFRDPVLTLSDGRVVDNPLFADLDPSDGLRGPRPTDRVFVAGIVGVPWQDIARDPADLSKGFKDAEELSTPVNGTAAWDVVLGPAGGGAPLDPLMIESIAPRSGVNPVTGEKLAQPGDYQGNGINGNEFSIPKENELQYACIFPLEEPRLCDGTDPSCDCADPRDKPVCDATPGMEHWQTHAKAYPGTRHAELIRSLGPQGVLGSVCPAPSAEGYRPAVDALIERLKQRLRGQCLPRSLAPNEDGQVACVVVELSNVGGGACACDGAARLPVTPEHLGLVETAMQDPQSVAAGYDCACEVQQLAGPELAACQDSPSLSPTLDGQPVDGFCYVDATLSPPLGNPLIVEGCASTERHALRFVGAGQPPAGATHFIACVTDSG